MSNYDGKVELPQMYNNQWAERYLSSDKSDTYLWLAEENTKQAKEIKRLQEQIEEANELIKECCKRIEFRKICLTSFPPKFKIDDCFYNELEDYFKKYGINWGVK